MTPKPAPKKAPKPSKKPVKTISKTGETSGSAILAHWLHDVSLESGGPVRVFAPGDRQLDLMMSANHATISQTGHVRLELRLRAHIHTAEGTLAVAEIKYAAVVEKLHHESELPPLLAEIYPFARDSLNGVLQLAGHHAPLPDTLEIEKIKT